MKLKLSILTFLVLSFVVFASVRVPIDYAKRPSLALPAAYEQAMQALGPSTNQFFCIAASISTSFSSDGEWFFTFSSTNSISKWVTVEFNGKTHVEDLLIR